MMRRPMTLQDLSPAYMERHDMAIDRGSDGDGKNAASLRAREPIGVVEYLHRVQRALIENSDDGWLLSIESHIEYTFTADHSSVERKGGTMLVSKAHGNIAELTIHDDTEFGEIVTHVEPGANQTWKIAKILIESAR